MVRIGKAPKRAIPLRTDEPFQKLSVIHSAGRRCHKIEVMGDGEQVIVDGIHPDTKALRVARGHALRGPSDDLPYVRSADIDAFLERATKLFITNSDFIRRGKTKANGTTVEPHDRVDGPSWSATCSPGH